MESLEVTAHRSWAFRLIALGGAIALPAILAWWDVMLGPPVGVWRVLLWPVDVLLWASGPGVSISHGRSEWTPVQDFATWIGAGIAWPFWLVLLSTTFRRLFPVPRRLDDE